MGEGLGKQAKILAEAQIRAALGAIKTRRYPERDRVMVLLSVRAGLRAKEIALATWSMATDAEGNVGDALHLSNGASKGKKGGRTIPLRAELREALIALKAIRNPDPSDRIIHSERDIGMSPIAVQVWFHRLYQSLGFVGASSSQRSPHVCHPLRQKDHRGRWLPTRRPGTRGSCVASDNSEIYSGRFSGQASRCRDVRDRSSHRRGGEAAS